MIKFTVGLALLILCVSVQAQTPRPNIPRVCRKQHDRCLSRENQNGRTNDVTNIFNNHCRAKSDPNWRNVSRCELGLANCQLTIASCHILSCENVKRALAGGGSGGPNPQPPTRTPRPRTTRRTPTTRRGGRTTTRRTPTTRRGGRTTTRRTPTTRRTTTPRIPTTRTARPPRPPRPPRELM